jgi:UDP-MurNAc hydroxylase
MRITLISHASLLVETNGHRILTDPWYEGRIYNNAWELCPPPPMLPDYTGLSALFISHAHPDHYHPDTLAKILHARGPDLPVFIAKFLNDAMRRDLVRLGFRRVVEMVPGREFTALPGVRFFSQQFRFDDSLLVIRGEGDETLVNINDTPLRGAVLTDLARRYPSVDYMAAQFAIAQGYPYCYEGVAADFDRTDLIRRFDSFARELKPRHTIPFASFVRFCHADNAHMNAHKTSLEELQRLSAARLTILYPGDTIDRGVVTAAPAHRAHFEAAQARTAAVEETRRIPVETLDQAMDDFARRLARDTPRFLLRRLPPLALLVPELGAGYSLADGRVARAPIAALAEMPIRYRMAAEVLYDSVRHDWGWADLSIGARFRAYVAPGWQDKEIWFWIIPMLAGEGYLRLWTLWFLRPRALRIWWGRRIEILDYLRPLLRGRFMTQVIRKKTSPLSAGGGE